MIFKILENYSDYTYNEAYFLALQFHQEGLVISEFFILVKIYILEILFLIQKLKIPYKN